MTHNTFGASCLRTTARDLEADAKQESQRAQREIEVEAAKIAAVLGDFAIADEHSGDRNDLQLGRLLASRGVRVLDEAALDAVRGEQAEVEEQRDDALAEVKRLRDVMDELTDVLFVPTDEIVDAVRRRLTPRVIETESELREFRIGTLIRDPRGRVWQRILGDEWVALGRLSAPDHVPLPARLLYAPEGGDL